jgi:hypothetical protein
MPEVPITADTLSGFGCTMVLVGIMVQSTTERCVNRIYSARFLNILLGAGCDGACGRAGYAIRASGQPLGRQPEPSRRTLVSVAY